MVRLQPSITIFFIIFLLESQFHYGSITTIVPFAGRGLKRDSLNSTMVRLQLDVKTTIIITRFASQFHYGSITTSLFGTTAVVVVSSQFHYGSITTLLNDLFATYISESQFHYGSITTGISLLPFAPRAKVSIPLWFDYNWN